MLFFQWKMYTCFPEMILWIPFLFAKLRILFLPICFSASSTALLSLAFLPENIHIVQYLSSYSLLPYCLLKQNYTEKLCKFRLFSSSRLVSHQWFPLGLPSTTSHNSFSQGHQRPLSCQIRWQRLNQFLSSIQQSWILSFCSTFISWVLFI